MADRMRSCVRPCRACPWRTDSTAAEIPRFDLDLAERLAAACPQDGIGPDFGAPLFACHESAAGREVACAGWLAVVGHAHPRVRLAVISGNIDASRLKPGEDWPALHASFDEVLAKLREGTARRRSVGRRKALAELLASSWRFDASDGAALFVSAWTDGVVDLAIKPPSGARDTATVGMTAAVAAELARAFRILARAPCRHGAELAPGRLKFDAPHLVVTEPDKGRSAQAKLTPTLLRRIAKALEAAADTARPNTTEEASNA